MFFHELLIAAIALAITVTATPMNAGERSSLVSRANIAKPGVDYGGGSGAAVNDVDDAFDRRSLVARHNIAELGLDYGGGNGAAVNDEKRALTPRVNIAKPGLDYGGGNGAAVDDTSA